MSLVETLPQRISDPELIEILAEHRVTIDFRPVPGKGVIEVGRSANHGSCHVDDAVWQAVRRELSAEYERRTGKPLPQPRTRRTQFGRKAGKKPTNQWSPTAQQRREAAVFDRRYPGTDD